MNFESEQVQQDSEHQPLGPKRGRPKGSKDKIRPPDAPRRGRPPKNINTSVSAVISTVKSHGNFGKSDLHQILIRVSCN